MKKVGIVLFSIMACISCQQAESISREEVIASLEKFDAGWKNKNEKLVDSVLSPSYVYFTQSGGTYGRENVVKTAASTEYKLDEMSRKQIEIKIEGNTAVVNTVWHGKGVYYGKPFDDRQRCSVTMVKNNGKVEILSEHCTPIQ